MNIFHSDNAKKALFATANSVAEGGIITCYSILTPTQRPKLSLFKKRDERSGGSSPVLADNIVTVPKLQKAQKGERAAKGLKCYSLALTGVCSFAILRTLPPAIVISKKTSLKIALFIRTTTMGVTNK